MVFPAVRSSCAVLYSRFILRAVLPMHTDGGSRAGRPPTHINTVLNPLAVSFLLAPVVVPVPGVIPATAWNATVPRYTQ